MVPHRYHKDCTKTIARFWCMKFIMVQVVGLLMPTSVRMDDTTFVPHVFPGKL